MRGGAGAHGRIKAQNLVFYTLKKKSHGLYKHTVFTGIRGQKFLVPHPELPVSELGTRTVHVYIGRKYDFNGRSFFSSVWYFRLTTDPYITREQQRNSNARGQNDKKSIINLSVELNFVSRSGTRQRVHQAGDLFRRAGSRRFQPS